MSFSGATVGHFAVEVSVTMASVRVEVANWPPAGTPA